MKVLIFYGQPILLQETRENDTCDVTLTPRLSCFDTAELEHEVGRLEDFEKPIPEMAD